jgi:hypothetical protein
MPKPNGKASPDAQAGETYATRAGRQAPQGGWRRVLRTSLALLAAPILLFEEFGWRPLARWLGVLARLPAIARLEARVRALSRWPALAVFAVPTLLLLPVKIAALALIGAGHKLLGLGVIAAAKLLGTALLGRIFLLTEPQLRQFGWMARALDAWQGFKQRTMAWLKASGPWRAARAAVGGLRQRWRRARQG